MSLKVRDWFLQLGLPSFRSMHLDAHGESGLTSSAKATAEKRARKVAPGTLKLVRNIAEGYVPEPSGECSEEHVRLESEVIANQGHVL